MAARNQIRRLPHACASRPPAPPFLCNLYSCRRHRSLRPSRRPNRPRHGVITITGIGDHLRPEWPITITGTRSGEGEGSVSNSPAPVQPKRPRKGMVHGIRPDELVRLTPKLKLYLRSSSPAWPDIVDAADWLRHDLGVSKSLWGDACLAMGRELAAVALAIVSTRTRSISGPRRAAISTAWSPRPKPASCTSSARCGPCAAPRSRTSIRARAGQGSASAVTEAGRGEACRPSSPDRHISSRKKRRPASVPERSRRYQIHQCQKDARGDEGEMNDDPPFKGSFIERLVANFQEAPQQRDCRDRDNRGDQFQL
jgi:replication protein C-like